MITGFSNIADSLRHIAIWAFSALISFLSPISFSIQSLFILFVTNILIGILADYAHGEKWQKKKIHRAFFESFLIYAFIFLIFSIGTSMRNTAGALQVVSTFTWVVIWYYGANINRNLILLSPTGSRAKEVFRFTYYVITLEAIKKIPFLKDYQEAIKRENNQINA